MSTAPSTIRSILFDLGSTLWEEAEPAILLREERAAAIRAGACLRELLSSAGIRAEGDMGSPWDDLACGQELRASFSQELRAAYGEQPLLEPDFGRLARRAARALGYDVSDAAWGHALYEAMRVRSLRARVLFPDVRLTLEELRGRGYTLGIVTNRFYGGPVFLEDLGEMRLLDFFDPRHIAVSADLGYRKPHPAIFLHAVEGLGRTPLECAMVGDKLGADVLGAKNLGMYAIWRPRPGEIEVPERIVPDATITQTADLLDLFPGV